MRTITNYLYTPEVQQKCRQDFKKLLAFDQKRANKYGENITFPLDSFINQEYESCRTSNQKAVFKYLSTHKNAVSAKTLFTKSLIRDLYWILPANADISSRGQGGTDTGIICLCLKPLPKPDTTKEDQFDKKMQLVSAINSIQNKIFNALMDNSANEAYSYNEKLVHQQARAVHQTLNQAQTKLEKLEEKIEEQS